MRNDHYCTIQVDADGLWAIERLLGRSVAIDPDPVYEKGISSLLSLFEEYKIRATFFIVADDLASEYKKCMMRSMINSGHEIASHGYSHKYLTMISHNEVIREIAESKTVIEEVLGVRVSGFKAAGLTAINNMVTILQEANYKYDCSVLATPFAPFIELALRVKYSKMGMITAPRGIYFPSSDNIFRSGNSRIVEVPVTLFPFLRFPAHFSYMLAGGEFCASMLRRALDLTYPKIINYLFHPLDLVGSESIRIKSSLPGVGMKGKDKLAAARRFLDYFKEKYDFITSSEVADKMLKDRTYASSS